MKLRINYCCVWMLAALALNGSVIAAQSPVDVGTKAVKAVKTGSLSPAQLIGIRAVGQHILAAKRRDNLADPDQQQLEQIRITLNGLLDAEQAQSMPLQVPGQQARQTASDAAWKTRRDQARNQATALVKTLKQRVKRLTSVKPGQAQLGATHARMAVQRERLFARWADQLEAALNDSGSSRLQKLNRLRDAVNERRVIIKDARERAETPTLQAMPAPFVVEPKVSN